jgi:polysaccharide biosynthesis transport protein
MGGMNHTGGMNHDGLAAGHGAPLMPMGGRSFQGEEASFGAMLQTIFKRKLIILVTTAVIFGGVAWKTLRTKPVYESMVRLQIDPGRSSSLGLEDVVNEKGGDDSDSRMMTEVKLIQSDSVAIRVIDAMGLAKRTDFMGPSALHATVTDPRQMSPMDRTLILGMFEGALSVKIVPNTQLVELHFRSTDPALATEIVNTVADQYMQRNFQTHYEGAVQVSNWLAKQMAELQGKAIEAQEKLAEFQKQNNILGADENDNIITDRLKYLNQQVTEAEADRIVKEARYRMAQTGDAELIGSTVTNPNLSVLRGQQAELRAQLSELNSKFGSGYPKVKETEAQLKKLDGAIAGEIKKTEERMGDEYMASSKTESMLRAQFEEQKGAAYKLNEHAVQYSVLKHEVETSRELYDTLQVKLKVAGVTAGLNSSYITVVDPAEIPAAPIAPRVQSSLAMGFFGGLLTGLLLAFMTESFDDTVSTSAELESCSGLPVLCSVPTNRLKGVLGEAESAASVVPMLMNAPRSQAAEAFRGLRTSLLLSTPELQPKVIAIVSSIATEGKTTVTANLGVSFAQRGEKVLLIDGDLRRSSLHTQFGLAQSKIGASTLLTQRTSETGIITPIESLPNLKLLPAGPHPPNPAELLGSKRMVEVLEQFSTEFDRILIDTPPILSVADSLAVAHLADAVVLVVRSGVARKRAVIRVRDLLMRANSNLVGVVFNCVNLQLENYYRSQGTGYGKAMGHYYHAGDGEAD